MDAELSAHHLIVPCWGGDPKVTHSSQQSCNRAASLLTPVCSRKLFTHFYHLKAATVLPLQTYSMRVELKLGYNAVKYWSTKDLA